MTIQEIGFGATLLICFFISQFLFSKSRRWVRVREWLDIHLNAIRYGEFGKKRKENLPPSHIINLVECLNRDLPDTDPKIKEVVARFIRYPATFDVIPENVIIDSQSASFQIKHKDPSIIRINLANADKVRVFRDPLDNNIWKYEFRKYKKDNTKKYSFTATREVK